MTIITVDDATKTDLQKGVDIKNNGIYMLVSKCDYNGNLYMRAKTPEGQVYFWSLYNLGMWRDGKNDVWREVRTLRITDVVLK